MYTLTYYHPRTRVLRSISTPSRPVAFDAYLGLMFAGMRVRMWTPGGLMPVRLASRRPS